MTPRRVVINAKKQTQETLGTNKNAGFAVVLVLQGAVPALTTTNHRESR